MIKSINRGITLISLIITVIILLILAGITINAVIGDDGVLMQAKDSSEQTNEESAIEEMELAYVAVLSKYYEEYADNASLNKNTYINESRLSEELNGIGKISNYYKDMNFEIISLIYTPDNDSKNYNMVIDSNGKVKIGTLISKTENYEECYADLNGDGIVDGIIYVDFINNGSGQWINGNGSYSYSKIESNLLKNYYISPKKYKNDNFGENNIISPIGSGKNRFYVMSLEDVIATISGTEYRSFYWYYNSSAVDTTIASIWFGSGKRNTQNMIEESEINGYGLNNVRNIWGLIKSDFESGWFIPAVQEWAKFLHLFDIKNDNYLDYGLSGYYWTSSMYSTSTAWSVAINDSIHRFAYAKHVSFRVVPCST